MFFDFHHHNPENHYGIYNLNFLEIPKENQFFSIGFHPKDIQNITNEAWDWLYHYSRSPFCIALGECGLDGIVEIDEVWQENILERQILWANQIQKPIIIHCVRRFSQIIKFIKLSKNPMIIHGFNKKESIAEDLLRNGFYLSFGKTLLYNGTSQKIAEKIPLERMFLETDDKDFEIKDLYEKVSEIRKISVEALQEIIQENIKNLSLG